MFIVPSKMFKGTYLKEVDANIYNQEYKSIQIPKSEDLNLHYCKTSKYWDGVAILGSIHESHICLPGMFYPFVLYALLIKIGTF
jgi:hypothetical protein